MKSCGTTSRSLVAFALSLATSAAASVPTFYKDIAPILQRKCQGCHRTGDIGPMPLITYQEVRPWARAMRAAVATKKMPPWFADSGHGNYANDPSLSKAEIDVLTAWADGGAPRGDPKMAPKPVEYVDGWRIGKPDVVIEIPKAFHVPASGEVPYQYISVPTGFTEDRWVESVEIRPSNRKVVHHIIASAGIRPGTAGRVTGEFFTSDAESKLVKSGRILPQFGSGAAELLQVYVPGGAPPQLRPGQAKLVKAGSNITFQLHYTTTGKEEDDQTRVGLIFAKSAPKERVKGILVFNRNFTIPAGSGNAEVMAQAEVQRDIRLVSMLPHMHVRGKDFEFKATYPSGETETLLRVSKYNFNWQINYYLEKPKLLPKGTIIECLGHYDNTPNNPHNPDPKVDVHYGEQTWEEMLNGFMEIAMDPILDSPELLGKAPEQPVEKKSASVINDASKPQEPAGR